MVELVIVISILVVMIWLVAKLPGGCSGDCYQGRKTCNCKREMNNGKAL